MKAIGGGCAMQESKPENGPAKKNGLRASWVWQRLQVTFLDVRKQDVVFQGLCDVTNVPSTFKPHRTKTEHRRLDAVSSSSRTCGRPERNKRRPRIVVAGILSIRAYRIRWQLVRCRSRLVAPLNLSGCAEIPWTILSVAVARLAMSLLITSLASAATPLSLRQWISLSSVPWKWWLFK